MHTTRTKNYSFLHDGTPEVESEVIIIQPVDPSNREGDYNDIAKIPYGDLEDFVVAILRRRYESRVEQMSNSEFLAMLMNLPLKK